MLVTTATGLFATLVPGLKGLGLQGRRGVFGRHRRSYRDRHLTASKRKGQRAHLSKRERERTKCV
eukprot:scaffold2515_cov136-Amphora_coffeaeformis.AAC.6